MAQRLVQAPVVCSSEARAWLPPRPRPRPVRQLPDAEPQPFPGLRQPPPRAALGPRRRFMFPSRCRARHWRSAPAGRAPRSRWPPATS